MTLTSITTMTQGQGMYASPINLRSYLNNKGTSLNGKSDGVGLARGETFPSTFMPKGIWLHDGIQFVLPDEWDDAAKDNIRADGQVISLPEPAEVSSLHLVAVGDDPRGALHGEAKFDFRFSYENGSTDTIPVEIKNWWSYNGMNKSPIRAPFHFDKEGVKNNNVTNVFHFSIPLPLSSAGKHVASIGLPSAGKWNALHVFAMSFVPRASKPSPSIQDLIKPVYVRATRAWEDVGLDHGQVVEVSLANPFSSTHHGDPAKWIDHLLTVDLEGSTFKCIKSATVARLMPGDEIHVKLLVSPTSSSDEFVDSVLTFNTVSSWSVPVTVEGARLVHDFTAWKADEDVEQHSAPAWFTGAKFGIFIHWGLYSVPAWADSEDGKYSEWYWFWQNTKDINGPGTYDHHLKTYGPDFVYDDFISQFTADKFDPTAWVDLFADAGAKYFVFTAKHHDGYALFDTEGTSDRNSLLLGPKRDFLKELFDAAKTKQPDIKRCTYYSMPEWYNPLYEKYGRDDGALSFLGGLAHNPYKKDQILPYTGFVDVGDYISGLQVPQMKILADKYKTEMIWGDIGMANDSIPFAAEFYSKAAAEGRQVTINNRLGIAGDFVTPEMEKFSTVQSQRWESCASVDPYSFGYNTATKDDEYRSVTDLVHSLIDIVAKGGNFLLNIGPRHDGVIVEPITKRLLDIGKWLKINGRAIYDTDPFRMLPEIQTDSIHVQFTRTCDTLNLISLNVPPTPTFVISAPLPILQGDNISLLTDRGDIDIPFSYKHGVLEMDLSGLDSEVLKNGIAYVFEIRYKTALPDSASCIANGSK